MKIFGYEIVKTEKLDKLVIDMETYKNENIILKEEKGQLEVDLKTVQMLWDIEANNNTINK